VSAFQRLDFYFASHNFLQVILPFISLLSNIQKFIMAKKKNPKEPFEIPFPGKRPEIDPDEIPDNPVLPEEDPEIIPDDEPSETPPYEIPPPGEGP
jgi:hypothetical protein